jgi:chloramphenicol 3-O-phosphotransferase
MRKMSFYVLCFFCITLIFFGVFFLIKSTKKNAQVIVINGISSAGKSTLADSIKKSSDKDCSVVRLDDYFSKIISINAKLCGWIPQNSVSEWAFLKDFYTKKTGRLIFDYQIRANFLDYTPFYEAIAFACQKYEVVIIDGIIESQKQYDEIEKIIKGLNVVRKLVYCPLEVVAQRIKNRSDMASFSTQGGISLSIFESFMAMYSPNKVDVNQKKIASLERGSIKKLLNESIAHALHLATEESFIETKEYTRELKKRFLSHFKLSSEQDIVDIYSVFLFDELIVSSNN